MVLSSCSIGISSVLVSSRFVLLSSLLPVFCCFMFLVNSTNYCWLLLFSLRCVVVSRRSSSSLRISLICCPDARFVFLPCCFVRFVFLPCSLCLRTIPTSHLFRDLGFVTHLLRYLGLASHLLRDLCFASWFRWDLCRYICWVYWLFGTAIDLHYYDGILNIGIYTVASKVQLIYVNDNTSAT